MHADSVRRADDRRRRAAAAHRRARASSRARRTRSTWRSRIRDIARRAGVPYVFKASYDKANRTSGRSFRGPGLDEGLRVLGARARSGRRADPDRHPRAGAGGAGRRSRRRAADSGVPRRGRPICSSPPRGPAASSTSRRDSSSRRRHAARHREGHRAPATRSVHRHRARLQLRLQQPRRRHARVSDPARARLPGRLRRHAQPAAAGRRRRRHGRPGGVHRADGVGRRRGRRRRRVPGSPRAAGAGARATRRTRCGSICSSRCSDRLVRIHAIAARAVRRRRRSPA